MSYERKGKHPIAQAYHAPSLLNQAAPVINTWYTIANLASYLGLEILFVNVNVNTTGETLDVRFTIDGTAYTMTGLAAVADTDYQAYLVANVGIWADASGAAAGGTSGKLKCKAFRAEVRKTTANGAGNLTGAVMFSEGT